MKLKTISEVQRKTPTTSIERTNLTGALSAPGINDTLHKNKKPPKKNKRKKYNDYWR